MGNVESLREHYALTVRHWIRNLEAQHAAIVRLQDERTYRIWRLLLAGGVQLAEEGQANLLQTLLSKFQDFHPTTSPWASAKKASGSFASRRQFLLFWSPSDGPMFEARSG